MCSDLIFMPLNKLKQLSLSLSLTQRASGRSSVPANVGWTPPRKVLRFTLAKINLAGPQCQVFPLTKSQL